MNRVFTVLRRGAFSLVVAFVALPASAQPPSEYDLSDVVVRYRQVNALRLALPDPCKMGPHSIEATLHGGGELVVERKYLQDVQCPDSLFKSKLPSSDFSRLVNEIYRARFFELGDTYSSQPGIHVGDDGHVVETITVSSDVPEFTLSVEIGDFHKTVALLAGAEVPSLRPIFETIRDLAHLR